MAALGNQPIISSRDIQLQNRCYIFLSYFTDVEIEAKKCKDLNPSHMSVKGTSDGGGWVELLGASGRFGLWHLSQVCNTE